MPSLFIISTFLADSSGGLLPQLSDGTWLTLILLAVGYGMTKNKAESVETLRREMNDGFKNVNEQLMDINRALGRVEGPTGSPPHDPKTHK